MKTTVSERVTTVLRLAVDSAFLVINITPCFLNFENPYFEILEFQLYIFIT